MNIDFIIPVHKSRPTEHTFMIPKLVRLDGTISAFVFAFQGHVKLVCLQLTLLGVGFYRHSMNLFAQLYCLL
jgi:hypothetical protein